MERPGDVLIVFSLLLWSATAATTPVDIGVVLDVGTLVGKIGQTSIKMAVEDFYAAHPNYTSRLLLHTRDSHSDRVQAASAALDLLQNSEVKAIIGPQKSTQAIFLSDLAQRSRVPLLSFSATSPAISSLRTRYFVRATTNDSSQVPALAALIKAFGWREAVPIYEDTEYGRDIVPYLIDALQEIDTRIPYRSVIPVSISEERISEELYKLMTMQTRVFIVHMSSTVSSRLFSKARELGMMSKGYVWITTSGLLDIIDYLSSSAIASMQGVLGVKMHVPGSQAGDDFAERWQKRFRRDNPDDHPSEMSLLGLWAYDAVWALATAVEKSGAASSTFTKPQNSINSTELDRLNTSIVGPRLLQNILKTRFTGVSGDFRLVDGQLPSSAYQIINVVGRGGRGIGFWTPENGISKQLASKASGSYTTLSSDMDQVIWPGGSTDWPMGWEIPTSGKKLRIGVPVKDEFHEFVTVKRNPVTNVTVVTGYCIDVFEAVIMRLPYALPHEFVPFEESPGDTTSSYNDLVQQVYLQKYDAVVGDTTIRDNRSQYVDFTLPFTQSGVAMIVPVEESGGKSAWFFLDPLSLDLWFSSFAFFLYTGFVVWVIEHRINNKFRGPIVQQLGTVFYFSFSTMVFAHREKVEHILSRLVVVIWVFVVLILTSNYTASLTSTLTVERFYPTITNLQELQKGGNYVGYHRGSYVEGLLKQLKFDESKMRAYNYTGYTEALSKGSKKGGVSALILEIPYIKLFFAQHCTGYTMIGPIFEAAGFGFVFPKGSPLVHDISKGILSVMEGDTLKQIEKKWFGEQNACLNQGGTIGSSIPDARGFILNTRNFWGLFLITGMVSTCSLLIFFAMFFYQNRGELRTITNENKLFRQRLAGWFKYYNKKDSKFYTFRKDRSGDKSDDEHVESRDDSILVDDSFNLDEAQYRISTSNLSDTGSYPIEDEENTSIEQASPATNL